MSSILFLTLLFGPVVSKDASIYNSEILVIKDDFELDGNPYKAIWSNVPSNYLKYSDAKIAGIAARYQKQFKLIISKKYLYILFKGSRIAESKSSNIDEKGFEINPQFGIWLSANKKKPPVYFISIDANNKLTHALIKNNTFDFSWNPIIETIVKNNRGDFVSEIKVPLADLKLNSKKIYGNVFAKDFHGIPQNKRKHMLGQCIWVPGYKFESSDFKSLTFGTFEIVKKITPKDIVEISVNKKGKKKMLLDFEVIQDSFQKKDLIFVPFVEKGPEIDGKLNDVAWEAFTAHNSTVAMSFFNKNFPYPPEINQTTFKMVSDKNFIYVSFQCDENNMKNIVSDSKALWADDIVDVLLDMDLGQSMFSDSYFIIENNPVGKNNLAVGTQKRWKPKSYRVKTSLNKNSWTVEFKIGWEDLGIKNGNIPLLCGANFLRYRATERGRSKDLAINNTEFSWVGNYIGDPHMPEKFGLLYFQQGNSLSQKLAKLLGAEKLANNKTNIIEGDNSKPKIEQVSYINRRGSLLLTPVVTKLKKDQVKIEFKVTNEIDVCVNILDKNNKIICHLAAGVIGSNSPSPYQKGFSQSILWNYTDDFNKKVSAKEVYKVAVLVGMNLEFDKVVVGDPHKLSAIRGICTDQKGNLFVLNETKGHGHYRSYHILSFNKKGEFTNEIMPPPSTLSLKDVAGISPIQLYKDEWMPIMYKPALHTYIPQLGSLRLQSPVVNKKGELILSNHMTEVLMHMPHRLIKIGSDGSVKSDYKGPVISQNFLGGVPSLALSNDEEFMYITGFTGKSRWGGSPQNVVYRLPLKDDDYDWRKEFRKPFIGELFVSGSKELLNNPKSLTVTENNSIVIADMGNNRIVKFNSDGLYKAEFAVNKPFGVNYSKRNKCYYVFSLTASGRQIIKFNSIGERQCSFNIPPMYRNRASVFCIDDSGDQTMIHYQFNNSIIKQLVDTGFNLVEKGDLISGNIRKNEKLNRVNNFDSFELSHDGKKIFLTHISAWGYSKKYSAFDSVTGNPTSYDRIYQWGGDGNLYSKDHGKTHAIQRFDNSGKPKPFEKTKVIKAKTSLQFGVDKAGFVYVPYGTNNIRKYSPDGSLVNNDFIKISLPSKTGASVSSFAIDKDGFFYIAGPIKSKNKMTPDFFKNKLSKDVGLTPGPNMAYSFYYSSILKFKPQGGASVDDVNGKFLEGRGYSGLFPVKIDGLVWDHYGMSPYNYRTLNHGRCVCEHGKFSKSANDLIYYTDAMRYSIVIIDKNKNVIKRIGKYGNNNSFLKDSDEPNIGFAWPTCVKATDDACFVSDKVNRKIIRLNYIYLQKEIVDIK